MCKNMHAAYYMDVCVYCTVMYKSTEEEEEEKRHLTQKLFCITETKELVELKKKFNCFQDVKKETQRYRVTGMKVSI